ncbi:hypothetical protein JCM10908_003140 [Rhodotorula pacifica]|uniref:uncharacterized protein n=1 Tax=Rhodotorula pacifica TaxID=1495444 RepID=UPI00317D123D
MGLFNKKDKNLSPSGFFTAEMTPSEEKDERSALRRSSVDNDNNEKRNSTASSSSAAAATGTAGRTSTDRTGVAHPGAGPARVDPASNAVKPNLHDAEVAGAAGTHHHHGDRTHEDSVLAREAEQDRHDKSSNLAGVGAGGAAAAAAAAATASHHHNTHNRDSSGFTSAGEPLTATTGNNAERSLLSEGAASGHPSVKEAAMPPHGHHAQPAADAALSQEEAAAAEHDHKYLQPVIHERRHVHEVEEVERVRTVDRHVHHVQTHVQPLLDERHLEEVHSYREVPVTHVEERHANSPEEAALLARLNAQSISTYTVVPHDRVKVYRGETHVTENVIHHYHTIVQPVWQRDLHEFYRLNSNFTPQTMIHPNGQPLSASAFPSAPPQNFQTVSHPAGAPIVPGGPSMTGVPPASEGHKLIPDTRREVGGEATKYEVEFINREPIFASTHRAPLPAGQTGMVGSANPNRSGSVRTAGAGSSAVSSALHGAHGTHGTHGTHDTLATHGTHGAHGTEGAGLEPGVRNLNIGSAR